jgi:hypothetical protein
MIEKIRLMRSTGFHCSYYIERGRDRTCLSLEEVLSLRFQFNQFFRNNFLRMDSAIDGLIDDWHGGAGEGKSLAEFLGMTDEEYAAWAGAKLSI